MDSENIEAFNARVRRRNARILAEEHTQSSGKNPRKSGTRTVRRRPALRIGQIIGGVMKFSLVGGLAAAVGFIIYTEMNPKPPRTFGTYETAQSQDTDQQTTEQTSDAPPAGVTDELAAAGDGAVEVASMMGRAISMLQSPHETLTPYIPQPKQGPTDKKGRVVLRQGPAFGTEVLLSAATETLPITAIHQHSSPPPARLASVVALFDANETCTFRAPLPPELVAGVRVEHGRGPTVAHAFGADELLAQQKRMIRVGQSQGIESPKFKRLQRAVRAVDVYVTDQTAPIYLVLQSMGSVAWRIHIADGVTVAHIALIGDTSTALLEPPAGVTYEAVLGRDFSRSTRQDENSARPKECTARAVRTPKPTWAAYEGANRGVSIDRNLVTNYITGHAAYGTWYRSVFAQGPDENTVTAFAADHVLVGPHPQRR